MLAGSTLTNPTNGSEYAVVTITNLLGLFLWAIVQGVVCAMLSTGDPFETEYQNNLDSINFFMNDLNIDKELRRRMRGYLRSTKNTKKRNGYISLVKDNFSQELQEEIRFDMSGHLFIKAVPFLEEMHKLHKDNGQFRHCELFFERISLKVLRRGFAPQETILNPSDCGIFTATHGVQCCFTNQSNSGPNIDQKSSKLGL